MTSYAWNIVENVKYECFRWLLHHFPYYLSMYIVFSIYLKIQDFYDFQLWVLQLSMLIFKLGEVFGYHWLYFFKTHYQTFLQLKMPPLTCTFRICTLDFVIFFKIPTNLCCQRFSSYSLNFPLLLPKWFIIQK